jgi:hypothetical protein
MSYKFFRYAKIYDVLITYIKISQPVSRRISNLVLTFVAIFSYLLAMKKIALKHDNDGSDSSPKQKQSRENVWCAEYGYFIDLDACRARSLQQKKCRRCYASLIQVPLPF